MVKYTSHRQLSFEEFETHLGKPLDGNNRWVRLSNHIPWDDLVAIYARSLRSDFGRPSVDARVVIGAMLIKHIKSLTDEETIEEIRENPYLQYFIGLKEFSYERVFDPSLFVTLRKRMGVAVFDEMTEAFIKKLEAVKQTKRSKKASGKKKETSAVSENKGDDVDASASFSSDQHKGLLLIDATVAPQDIRYPTDLDLLNRCREDSEKIIDELYEPAPGKRKPRTHRKNARQDYLSAARKRKKSGKMMRKALRKQLNYLKRNIKTIHALLDSNFQAISARSLHRFWVIQEIYRQQKQMYDGRSHRISNRIVSVSQPHVRPIVRGKSGKAVEFGAKISASVVDGFAFIDRIGWDAYNESGDLKVQVERYRQRHGYYPEAVIADQIYGTRANRDYLKRRGIRFSGKPLGRPPKLSKEQKKALVKEARLRNGIEGKFGEGKRKYDLGIVKAKTLATSESWIAAVFFAMNIAHWLRACFFASIFRRLIWHISTIFKELLAFKPRYAVNF
jgi:hypothetical protein